MLVKFGENGKFKTEEDLWLHLVAGPKERNGANDQFLASMQ